MNQYWVQESKRVSMACKLLSFFFLEHCVQLNKCSCYVSHTTSQTKTTLSTLLMIFTTIDPELA